jgi:hypothetical protein
MKKLITTLTLMIAISCVGYSQYYEIPYISVGQNPGNLNTETEGLNPPGWTSIQTTSATPVWAPNQSIPFAFNFNGSPVSRFKVSTSGVLTFDTTAVAVPGFTSAALPSASIPNNSVCIWGLAGTGSNDAIYTKTFGSAPNRQFWVHFNSFSCTGSTGYSYWAIVFEEGTNNIYVVDMLTANCPLALAIGIQVNSTTAYEVPGSPTLGTNSVDDATPADNSYYKFIFGVQPLNSIALTVVAPASNAISAFGASGSTMPVGGTIRNLGSAPITAFTAKYTDGTTVSSSSFTGLSVAPLSTYNFTFTTPYTIPTPSFIPLKTWVTLTGDADHSDDTLNTVVRGYSFVPTHKVVIEEGTGTWCGWCPRGAVFMDSMSHVHPNTTELIAVHDNINGTDPMAISVYDNGVSAAISGYPSILVDRNFSDDPSNAFVLYDAHINDFGLADLTVSPAFNYATSVATVNVSAKIASSFVNNTAANDYRLAVVFTRNDVTSTSSQYNQNNYYSSASQNQPLVGAGHNWQTEPATVPASRMIYNFVALSIVGGFSGMAGSLPANIVAGQTYSSTFTYTVPVVNNLNNIKIHALLIDANNQIIYNGNSANLVVAGISSIVKDKQTFRLYPNPAVNNLNLDLELDEAENVTVSFINMLGQIVHSESVGHQPAGKNTIGFDVSSLPAGAYFVNVTTSKGTASGKFIK